MAQKNPTKSVVNRWERSEDFRRFLQLFFFENVSPGQCGDELTYLRAVFFLVKRVEEPNHQQQKLKKKVMLKPSMVMTHTIHSG